MLTRRQFLLASALLASPFSSLAFARSAANPPGVIAPYQWGQRRIPIGGENVPAQSIVDMAVLEVMRKHNIVGCSVCITRGGEVTYLQGYGYAELPGTPFLPTMATRCGGLSQAVTALAALVLIDEGQLNLESKLVPLLRNINLTPKPVGGAKVDERINAITVRDLMDHTSGLPQNATYTAWRPERNVAQLHGLSQTASAKDVAADALGNFPLLFVPGTKFQPALANYVLLARAIEASCGMSFGEYLSRVVLPKLGVTAEEIYISQNQTAPDSPARGSNEVAYYQQGSERFASFLPSEQVKGRVFGEAYHGFAPESSDGAIGLACSATGLARILTNLNSAVPALSPKTLRQVITPPKHYTTQPGFNAQTSVFFSKGFSVQPEEGKFWLSQGGSMAHCGGAIAHNAGYQFVVLSNSNKDGESSVDAVLTKAVSEAIATARARGVIA